MADWHEQARRLADAGEKHAVIAAMFEVSEQAVWCAVNPERARAHRKRDYRKQVETKTLVSSLVPDPVVVAIDDLASEAGLSRRAIISEILRNHVGFSK